MNNFINLPKNKGCFTRSKKQKNQNIDTLLMEMFNFSYAGRCDIFIHKRGKKFELVHNRIHLVEDIFTFSPNYVGRFIFDDLYHAILAFNKSVSLVCSSLDWFCPDMFSGTAIYDEVFKE